MVKKKNNKLKIGESYKICSCGCGGFIIFQRHHKYRDIKYIHNHHRKESKNKIIEKICECGCDTTFSTINSNQRFILGHNYRFIEEFLKVRGRGITIKGKTYEEIYGKERANKIKKIMRNKNIGEKNPCYGRKITEKEKIQRRFLILNNPNYGMKNKKHSQESIKKIKEARANQIFPKQDTSIEIKIQNFLKQLRIEFFTHQYMKIDLAYRCDIFIPSLNLIIECDGDYWHGNPDKFPNLNKMQLEQIEEDKLRTQQLLEKGYNVIRLWENEIRKMKINDLKIKLENGI